MALRSSAFHISFQGSAHFQLLKLDSANCTLVAASSPLSTNSPLTGHRRAVPRARVRTGLSHEQKF